MRKGPNFYGLDIETDLEPGAIPSFVVRKVAVSGLGFEHCFEGPEADVLQAISELMAVLPTGIVATWNGSTFDLPVLAERGALAGIDMGILLEPDERLGFGRPVIPTHGCAYRAAWWHHNHLDTFVLDQVPTRRLDSETSRKLLIREATNANAANDARLARALAEKRVSSSLRKVDEIRGGRCEPPRLPTTDAPSSVRFVPAS